MAALEAEKKQQEAVASSPLEKVVFKPTSFAASGVQN